MNVTVRQWDGQEWVTVTREATALPDNRTGRVRHDSRPVDRTGLSDGSPLPELLYTAYSESDGFADMRRGIPKDTLRTHRKPVPVQSVTREDDQDGMTIEEMIRKAGI